MERGFDKLMTPGGVLVVTAALFLFFVVIAAGGVAWRLAEREARGKRGE